jgi:NADH-quinone oxidoreductase subunit H
LFIWLRGTLPRLRYDQFMAFGWKRLIPIALVWIIAVAAIRAVSLHGGFNRSYLYAGIAILAAIIVLLTVLDERSSRRKQRLEEAEATEQASTPFDAFAGGYPVPPMPGQVAPTVTATSEPVPAGEEH